MTLNNEPYFNLSDFQKSKYIIAAVSGGSDSLALLFLLQEFLQKHGEAWRLIAITIDHRLRAESASEAQAIHELCTKHKIKHDIFVWQGEKPKAGISEKARTARYNLLCQAASHYQSKIILTGHTLDDQIETFRMRQMRLSMGRGLAGMARGALLQQKFTLLRPLLNCSRTDLRDYLTKKNISWVDDPSNDNVHYERVRIRKNPVIGEIDAIKDQLHTAKLERENNAQFIAKLLLQTNAHWCGEQLVLEHIDDSLRRRPVFIHFIEILTALIGGKAFLKPAPPALNEFLLKAPQAPQKTTHSATLIENRYNTIRLWREQRNLNPIMIKAGETRLWDGRFSIHNGENADFLVRGPLLDEIHAILKPLNSKGLDLKGFNVKNAEESKSWPNNRHMPSLLTSPLIQRHNSIELPFIAAKTDSGNHYTIKPVLLPFHWLASGHDFAMLAPLQQLFDARMVINAKIDGFDHKNLAEITSCTLASGI